MKYKIDHDLHIHSYLSSCSRDKAQTGEGILEYAKRNKLHTVAVTDHYWDSEVPNASSWYAPQNFDNIKKILPLPKDDNVKFLFGCEAEMDWNFTVSVPEKRFCEFDFIIIPTTHLQMTELTIRPEDAKTNEGRAKAWIERFDALLNSNMPFEKLGVAHLACGLIQKDSKEDYLKILDLIPDDRMEGLFARAAEIGVGIEINSGDIRLAEELGADRVLRMFKIAKWQNCKFYLGSDAHSPKDFALSIERFERAIDLLGLKESDKYEICKL